MNAHLAVGLVIGVFVGGTVAMLTLEEHAAAPADCAERMNAAARACQGPGLVVFEGGEIKCRGFSTKELRP